MKHEVSTLSGALLDRAVALALGAELRMSKRWERHDDGKAVRLLALVNGVPVSTDSWAPSADDVQAGRIIDSERIGTAPWNGGPLVRLNGRCVKRNQWLANHPKGKETMVGDGRKEAAMRAFVAARLGPVVDLPDVEEAPAAPGATT